MDLNLQSLLLEEGGGIGSEEPSSPVVPVSEDHPVAHVAPDPVDPGLTQTEPVDPAAVVNILEIQPRAASTEALLEGSLDRILDFCPLPDVMTFGQTSRHLRWVVRNYLERRLNTTLKVYVDSPLRMREVMRDNQCVLSGSSALDFVLGADKHWESADLDIYAPLGAKCASIIRYLHNDGYETTKIYDHNPSFHPYGNQEFRTVTKLFKIVELPGREPRRLSIDVIESQLSNSLAPILRFHTTAVMNWISADSITVAYPSLTFQHIGVYGLRPGNPRQPRHARWMNKYTDRGFLVVQDTSMLAGPCGNACRALWRATNDVGCLSVTFNDDEDPGRAPIASYEEMVGNRLPHVAWCLARGRAGIACYNPTCPNTYYEGNRLQTRFFAPYTAKVTYGRTGAFWA
ncbi:hypothetical protein FRB99_000512 [Tulasnella sp. 403]|nr:hypothetical protein FRB99_000512 [Tulasnella sp. 403]